MDTKVQFRNLIGIIKKLKDGTNANNSSEADEAIISKRPLQYCGSCNKELPFLSQQAMGYSTWGKLPTGEPLLTEHTQRSIRHSMYGEFQKILPSIK
jgi:hypothetical protein